MGRRRTNLIPDNVSAEPKTETLSKENQDVMDNLLTELIEDIDELNKKEEKCSNQDKNQEDLKLKEYNHISKFSTGDRVKLKENVKFDILGHRIHAGIHNYTYTVRLVRDDGMVVIECLTIILTVQPQDIIKMYL